MRHGLGRRPALDPRDQQHLMRSVLPEVIPPRKITYTWSLRWKGNQGQTPQCVGYAWHGLLRALPMLQREPLPQAIYTAAQLVDEFPDTPPADGTSVRAGAKVLLAQGKLTRYVWAFSLEDVLNWLPYHGPVVLGTDWKTKMFTPDSTGLVTVSGDIAGGHAYLAIGYNDKTKRLLCQNSWGTSWGVKGRFSIRYDDVDALIKNGGEAVAPTET